MRAPWNIDAGELKHLVTIESKPAAPAGFDSRGHPERTWSTAISNVNAAIYTGAGRKLDIARQQVPTATHVFAIRYRPGLNEENNRVNYLGRILNIGAINDIEERHVRLELICTEQKSGSTVT